MRLRTNRFVPIVLDSELLTAAGELRVQRSEIFARSEKKLVSIIRSNPRSPSIVIMEI
jgi:hypothetical protein